MVGHESYSMLTFIPSYFPASCQCCCLPIGYLIRCLFCVSISSCPSPGGHAGLVYSYGEDDLNRTEDVEDKVSGDEDSRESNSVSI